MQAWYDFFEQFAPELMLFALVGLIVVLLWTFFLAWRLQRLYSLRRSRLRLHADGTLDIETMVQHILDTLDKQSAHMHHLEESLNALTQRVDRLAGHVGIVRFNPFQETGGNQSFAIAILDSAGNGVTITSLHSRDGTRVYAKPVEKGQSEYALSDEEREAIALAMQHRAAKPSNA
ncbi:MAG: DUF4446 family protein [Ardenticatenia bacterium]|nr:MAG: DUF4446 family protein [Ardenticatenia bacterium]